MSTLQGQEANPFVLHALDGSEITRGAKDNFHSSIRYNATSIFYNQLFSEDGHIKRSNLVTYSALELQPLDSSFVNKTAGDDDNSGFWSTFYKTPKSLYEVGGDNFYFRINPILAFGLGEDNQDDELIFQNTRGLIIEGQIDNKLYFHTQIRETQRRFYNYLERQISNLNAIPGQGFYKNFQSSIFSSFQGWDYLNSQAFFGLQISKSIDINFGHGKNFIGNGYHSLLLNDYAHNYLYLKVNTVFWKVHYQNIFAELSAFSGRDTPGNTLIPKKYLAAHYLDINFTPNFSLGFFEAVIFTRDGGFDLQYLNPVILYRAVEQFSDSPDNVLLGFNFKYNIHRRAQVYGQFLIDELRVSEAFSGKGWWGNKTGFQLGVKIIDPFNVKNLRWLTEYNTVRPFTYAHRPNEGDQRVIANYSHYNQPLAHPLNSNFREWMNTIDFQATNRWHVSARVAFATRGQDEESTNYGSNILTDYTSRTE